MKSKSTNGTSLGTKVNKAVVYLLLTVGAVIMLLPFYYMISTSTKTSDETFTAEMSCMRPTVYPGSLTSIVQGAAGERWTSRSSRDRQTGWMPVTKPQSGDSER